MMSDEGTTAQPLPVVQQAEGIRNVFARLLAEIDGAQCKSFYHDRCQGHLAIP